MKQQAVIKELERILEYIRRREAQVLSKTHLRVYIEGMIKEYQNE